MSAAPKVTAPVTPREYAEAAKNYDDEGYALCSLAEDARKRRDSALAAALDRDGAGLIQLAQTYRKVAILQLRSQLPGLDTDAEYAHLVSKCGRYSRAVLQYLLAR